MKKLFLLAVAVAFCFGTLAMAAELHATNTAPHMHHPRLVKHSGVKSNTALAADIYGVWQGFAGTPGSYYAGTNTDGSPQWPCFGGGTTANDDCASIGDPAEDNYGVEVGVPNYTWPLAGCNGNATSSNPASCGETETFYEDTTADTTDDLLFEVIATQGAGVYLVDTGFEDFGPDALGAPASAYPLTVIFSGAQNFGTLGQTGENNGNCDADYQYPVPNNISAGGTGSAPYPVYPYEVAANKTCVNPASSTSKGAITIETITELASTKYTALTTGEDGFGDACTKTIPCYKATFTKKYSATQKWTIWLD